MTNKAASPSSAIWRTHLTTAKPRATGTEAMFAGIEGDADIMFAGIRNPSPIKTIYNERDQPTETQALDADGRLLRRILRTYDEKGRTTDIRTMIEEPSPFSEKQMADLIAQAGVSGDDLGDVVEEQTLLTTNPRISAGVVFHMDEAGNPVPVKPAFEWSPQPEFPSRPVPYGYQYDRYGNWIEQTASCSDSPPYTRRREHTYY